MSFYVPGNRSITSTAAAATDPSTTALLAELTATNFGSTRQDRQYLVYAWVGGSTAASFVVEHATSTNIASSAVVTSFTMWSGGPTAQYVRRFEVDGNDIIRIRQAPASVAGTFHCQLQAEEIS